MVGDWMCRTIHRFDDSLARTDEDSSCVSGHHNLLRRNTRGESQRERPGIPTRLHVKTPVWVCVPLPGKRIGRASACSEILQRIWEPVRIEIICHMGAQRAA